VIDHGPPDAKGKAFEALAGIAVSQFDPTRSASVYARMARSPGLDPSLRREGAKRALALYAALGAEDETRALRGELDRLHPTVAEVADADIVIARSLAGDGEREAALARFYDRHRGGAVAPHQVVEAAYELARMKRAAGAKDASLWLARTVSAWDDLLAKRGREAQSPPYVDHAAEAAVTLLDDEIASHRAASYPRRVSEILGRWQLEAEEASRWDLRLEREVVRKYESPVWVVQALARQGAIFDALRMNLYRTTNPVLLPAAGEALVARLRASGQVTRADELEDAARDAWRRRKATELDGADEVMVRRYATAIASARAYGVTSPAVSRAIARLGWFTDVIGDAKLEAWVRRATDPRGTPLAYTARMYDLARPGLPGPPLRETFETSPPDAP
jgi:hypothetical protein